MDLALNNLQMLISHKLQPTNQPTTLYQTKVWKVEVLSELIVLMFLIMELFWPKYIKIQTSPTIA